MTDFDDMWDDPSAKRWVRQVLDDMAPKMSESALVMQLVPTGEHSEGDVKFWVELGASIMLDKPIIAILFGDDPCPPKLALIAEEVVRLPEGVTPDASVELAEAMKRILGDDDKEGQ